jgi:hypothetical protein
MVACFVPVRFVFLPPWLTAFSKRKTNLTGTKTLLIWELHTLFHSGIHHPSATLNSHFYQGVPQGDVKWFWLVTGSSPVKVQASSRCQQIQIIVIWLWHPISLIIVQNCWEVKRTSQFICSEMLPCAGRGFLIANTVQYWTGWLDRAELSFFTLLQVIYQNWIMVFASFSSLIKIKIWLLQLSYTYSIKKFHHF